MKILHEGNQPLAFPNLKISVTQEDSIRINSSSKPAVIISASGMCTDGRIKHHLKHNLWRAECTVALAGYQAEGTLGRQLADGQKDVRIFQEDIHVAAEIVQLQDVSAHADQEGLLHWLIDNPQKPDRVFVVHGDEEACTAFTDLLKKEHDCKASAPYSGFVYDLLLNDYVRTNKPEPVLTEAEKKEKILEDQNREQDTYTQNKIYNELMEKGKKLLRQIEKRKNAKNSELKKFLKEVDRLTDRWD